MGVIDVEKSHFTGVEKPKAPREREMKRQRQHLWLNLLNIFARREKREMEHYHFLKHELCYITAHSGCYNNYQRRWTGWLVNHTGLFLTVLGAGSPRSGFWHSHVLWSALFWVIDCHFLMVFSSGGKTGQELSRVPCMKGLILLMRVPALWPHHPSKIPPPKTTTMGVKISTCEFLGIF